MDDSLIDKGQRARVKCQYETLRRQLNEYHACEENRVVLGVCATTNKANFLANGSVGRYLAVNRSFTLEGFLRLKSGQWRVQMPYP